MKTTVLGLVFLILAPPAHADETKKTEPKTTYVPYRLTSTNHVLVRVKINGKGPYNFILDTGAPALFVATAVGRKLGVPADKDGWGIFNRFEIEGGVMVEKAKARIEDPYQLTGMNGLGLAGAELHGIIGYTVLARYRLQFDFTKHKMAWQPLDYKPPQPQGLGGKAGSAELDALGMVLKLLGAMLGKAPEPIILLRGFLGFTLEKGDDGIVVKTVLADSPAAAAGLKPGDRIRKFQKRTVSSPDDVRRLARKLAAYETAELGVARGNETLTIQIKAGKGL
jgi:hypothetical protein